MSPAEEKEMVKKCVEEFPKKFGLKNFPGKEFRVMEAASFFSHAYGMQLYVYVKQDDGQWQAFSKSTPTELRTQMVTS